MPTVKRTVGTRSSTRLATRASSHHSSVTLYELKEESNPQRPVKRVKLEEDEDEFQQGSSQDLIVKSEPLERKIEVKTESGKSKGAKETKPGRSPSKSPRKSKPIPQSLKKPHPAPENWREVYGKIKEMRKTVIAPVDTMGCHQAQTAEQDPKNRRFAILVSLMLSSQTKDEVTNAAVLKLREALGGSISVDTIIEADDSVISEAIGKVGFWRRKTQYLKQAALQLRDEFDSDVPKNVDELCSLQGVGPKMAFLALQVAWNLNQGIGVDVHVHRITNRLGWHKPPTKNPEETRLNLQSWLPEDLHADINHMLVGFGQMICLPVGPRCDQCTLSKDKLCPSAQTPKARKTKSVKIKTTMESVGRPKIELEYEGLWCFKEEKDT
ncbi:DNA glycosylase [Marasmius fiardii PR-910]|nr:DNA glycosylase [Marasmius fiardii PR-910]